MNADLFDMAVTEPGVYEIPEDAYHRDPVPGGSLSSGGARTLLEPGGPAKFAYRRGRQINSTTFDLGKAAHTVALGAGAGIVVVDATSWQTKAARQARNDAYAAGQIPVLADDEQHIHAMVDAVRSHPIAGALLAADGPVEQSLFWVDKTTGMWCRARHDKTTHDRTGRLLVVDLKTCENASESGITRSVANYGYHQQGAHYLDAVIALGLATDPEFVFVFVEKSPPHLVNVVVLDAEALEVGRRRNAAALRIFADCTRTDTWPGYGDEIAEISLPAFYPRQEF